jgi:TRAP-type transport system small permease protein
MNISRLPNRLLSAIDSVMHVANWIGYGSLTGLVVVTFLDVAGRYVLNKPLQGSLELSELAMAILGAFAIFYTTTRRGHINVDLFLIRFSRRNQNLIEGSGALLGFATWGLIAYRVFVLAVHVLKSDESSSLLAIPISPFQFIFALGLTLYALTLFIQALLSFVSEEPEKREGGVSI